MMEEFNEKNEDGDNQELEALNASFLETPARDLARMQHSQLEFSLRSLAEPVLTEDVVLQIKNHIISSASELNHNVITLSLKTIKVLNKSYKFSATHKSVQSDWLDEIDV